MARSIDGDSKHPKRMKSRPSSGSVAGLGFEMAAAVVGFSLVGYWVGGYYGNSALGITIGGVLGVIGGTYNMIRAALLASRHDSTRSKTTDRNQDSSG
ncbi:MAG: AtpZ/AtpI family protein [Thermoanaerobaculia bacterium]